MVSGNINGKRVGINMTCGELLQFIKIDPIIPIRILSPLQAAYGRQIERSSNDRF